jgi:hypothetical protein
VRWASCRPWWPRIDSAWPAIDACTDCRFRKSGRRLPSLELRSRSGRRTRVGLGFVHWLTPRWSSARRGVSSHETTRGRLSLITVLHLGGRQSNLAEAGRCRQEGARRAARVLRFVGIGRGGIQRRLGKQRSRSFGCRVGDRAGGLAGSRVRARASAVVGPARSSRPAPSEMRKGSDCWDARPPRRGRLDARAVDRSNPSSEASGAIARAGTEVHGRLFDCASDLEDGLYRASSWDDRQLPGFRFLTRACAETSARRPAKVQGRDPAEVNECSGGAPGRRPARCGRREEREVPLLSCPDEDGAGCFTTAAIDVSGRRARWASGEEACGAWPSAGPRARALGHVRGVDGRRVRPGAVRSRSSPPIMAPSREG